MSIRKLLEKASTEFIDASPVLPDGVRVVTHEKSAVERASENFLSSSTEPETTSRRRR
jgi:hypothetical protein